MEATRPGLDMRFVDANLAHGSPEWLYDSLYCARGQAENLIKMHKTQLSSDRTRRRCAAIDGDDLDGRFAQRRHPIDKAALERADASSVAKMSPSVPWGRPLHERAKPWQQIDLFRTATGDVGETIAPGERGQKPQPQRLVER